ncbi:MAG: hypothetical protein AAFR61_06020 [Bacteroidota bacterium]
MKLLVNKSLSLFLLIAFMSTVSTAFAGINCTKTYTNRTGTVYAGGPAKTTIRPTGNSITVKVKKTDGRAQTIVNIYVNNQRKSFIEFNNGNYTTEYRSRTVNNVKGKSVRVEIVNQSVGNKFSYRLNITGVTDALGSANGNLAGQGQKTVIYDKPCKNKIRINVTRTGGSARANVYIYKNGRKIYDEVMDRNDRPIVKEYSGARNATYKVVIKNVSVGNFFKYSTSAVQKN